MKALVVVNTPHSEWSFLGPDRTPVLLPLLDRPVLQHVIESLVSGGYTRFEVVASRALGSIRELLGEGDAWGVKIQVSPLNGIDDLQNKATRFAVGDPLLIVDAERIPTDDEPPHAVMDALEVYQGWERVDSALDVSTPRAYIESWKRVTTQNFPNLVQKGRSGNGPTFVGERTTIEAGCRVGANAFVGSDCVVSSGTSLEDCVVLPHTFVGPNLDLHEKIVYRSTVYDVGRNVSMQVESFLLGTTDDRPPLGERLVALGLGIALLPALIVGRLMVPFADKAGSSLGYSSIARDLCIRVAPGLWSVVAGRQHLVGLPSLDSQTRRDFEALAPGLLSQIPPGLLSEAYVKFGPSANLDQIWASVAFAVAGRGRRSQWNLVREYFSSAFGLSRPTWARNRG